MTPAAESDDNPAVVDILVTVLGEEGYGVSSAVTSDEGLKLFILSHPDLVLLDIALPGMNGIEMLRRVRSIAPTARVVMVSGVADPARSREALELGALACVSTSHSTWPPSSALSPWRSRTNPPEPPRKRAGRPT